MKTEHTISAEDAAVAIDVIRGQIADYVKFASEDEEYIERLQKVVDALENANRIVISG